MSTLVDALSRPEYTGERRCWPCTAVNLGAVALASLGLAIAGWVAVAVGVGVVGVVLVALRGYVVPYTPRFAPGIAAAFPGDTFDHGGPERAGTLATDDVDGEELLGSLLEAGIVEVRDEEVLLAPAVETRWHEEMDRLRDDDAALREAVQAATPAADVSVTTVDGQEWFVLGDGDGASGVDTWVARPVAIAEAAAFRTLGEQLPSDDRAQAAGTFRMFLDTCPDCGTPLEETSMASCCGPSMEPSSPDSVLACPDCETWLYRFPDGA